MRNDLDLKDFLDDKVEQYNNQSFIAEDPICIPHGFTKNQDIEIAGLFAATLAWGQRKTIISKCKSLMKFMDNSPHDFIMHHEDGDLKPFLDFKHRTFNATDTLFFLAFLRAHYSKHDSLEDAFLYENGEDIQLNLTYFHAQMFCLDFAPECTKKHVATPLRKSACKRLNMYLRWMVRQDDRGVDFGIWNRLNPSNLICPLDVHVERTARKLGLLTRKQTDWKAAIELTLALRKMDVTDPVKYDFALFGLGVIEKF